MPFIPSDFSDVFVAGTYNSHYVADVSTPEAYGSGCTPSSPDTLGDGVWFGFIKEWGSEEIGFDLACIGGAGQVSNENQNTRLIPVSDHAQYLLGWWLGHAYSVGDVMTAYGTSPYAFSFAKVVAAREEYPPPVRSDGVWIYINGGEVTQVETWVEAKDDDAIAAGTPYVPWGSGLASTEAAVGAYHPDIHNNENGAVVIQTPDADAAHDTGTLGSGCDPGAVDSLPDGVWYGFIVDMSGDSVVVDLACKWSYDSWESGPDTEECWTVEGSGLDNERCNDPLVSNDTHRERTNHLSPDAQVLVAYPFAVYSAVTIGSLENHFWPFDPTKGNWIYVNDGEVTAIAGGETNGWLDEECGC